MNLFTEFLNAYGLEILFTILTAIAGFIGMRIKSIYEEYVTDKRTKDVVETCVKAVEQLYHDLDGEEKYYKALESAQEMLSAKGIVVSSLELDMLIEATVSAFNYGFGKEVLKDGPNKD